MKTYPVIFALLASSLAFAQTSMANPQTVSMQKYQWSDALCEHQGYYYSSKFSAQNIADGFEIFDRLTQVNLPSHAPRNPVQLQAIDNDSVIELEADYLQLTDHIEKLSISSRQSLFNLEAFKAKLKQSIKNEYQIKHLGLMAYLDIDKALSVAPNHCKAYLIPLKQSPKNLQEAWLSQTLEHIDDQKQLGNLRYSTIGMKRYRSEKAEDAVSYAKLNLVGYAWHSCLNTQHHKQSLTSKQVYEGRQAFEKSVFGKTITSVCAEP